MNTEKAMLLELPEDLKLRLIKKAQRTIRQKAIEARALRELSMVENLTINGYVVWNESHQTSRAVGRRRPRKRHI